MKRWHFGRILQQKASFLKLWLLARSAIWSTLWYFLGKLFMCLVILAALISMHNSPDHASKVPQTYIYRYWLSSTHRFWCLSTCLRYNITSTYIVKNMKFIGERSDWVNGSTRHSVSSAVFSQHVATEIESVSFPSFQCIFQFIWL